MTYRVEYIVNTGQFQHVALTIEGANKSQFMTNIADFSDADKAKLGLFMAELESHVKVAHTEALSGAPVEPMEALLKGELGARVVEVREPGEGPSETPSEADIIAVLSSPMAPDDIVQKATSWSEPVKSKPKPWENQDSGSVDLDNLFG